jgi:hypothetical protein
MSNYLSIKNSLTAGGWLKMMASVNGSSMESLFPSLVGIVGVLLSSSGAPALAEEEEIVLRDLSDTHPG